jgi:hypothetical protein
VLLDLDPLAGFHATAWMDRDPAIVVHFFARESWMARRELTVQRHEEIKRRLAEGRSVREIASALSCSPVSGTEALRLSLIAEQSTAVEGAGATIGHRVGSGLPPKMHRLLTLPFRS